MTESEFNKAIETVTRPLPGSTPAAIVYRLPVKQRFHQKNIIDFYCESMPGIPKEIWIEKIKTGNITMNNEPVTIDTLVKAGAITQHSSEPQTEPEVSSQIKLIHYEPDFLVINKPAPLPMHPCGRFAKNSLISILRLAFPEEEFKLIHRIDANTTGLVVIGKTSMATKNINAQFENKTMRKEYLALVEGILDKDHFTSGKPISKELTISGGRNIKETGLDAFTEFKVIARLENKKQSLVCAIPHSGRTNQIRLHLADVGHPIIGDHGYKDPVYFDNNPLTYKDDCLFLHAWKLSFKHPITNEELNFTAEIPGKFPAF